MPKCPQCTSTSFTYTPAVFGGTRALMIYCSKCQTAIGVLPDTSDTEQGLSAIEGDVRAVRSDVRSIKADMRNRE